MDRIEKLENSYNGLDTISHWNLKEKLEKELAKLKKTISKWKRHTIQDYWKMSKVLTHVRNWTKEIKELKENIDYFKPLNNVNSLLEQIAELKEQIGGDNQLSKTLERSEKAMRDKNPAESKPRAWMGEVPLVYANEKKGDFGGDKSDIVSGTGGAAPTRNAECEDVNPEIINESQPPRLLTKPKTEEDYKRKLRIKENPSEQDVASSASHTELKEPFDLGKFNEHAFKLAMPPKEVAEGRCEHKFNSQYHYWECGICGYTEFVKGILVEKADLEWLFRQTTRYYNEDPDGSVNKEKNKKRKEKYLEEDKLSSSPGGTT